MGDQVVTHPVECTSYVYKSPGSSPLVPSYRTKASWPVKVFQGSLSFSPFSSISIRKGRRKGRRKDGRQATRNSNVQAPNPSDKPGDQIKKKINHWVLIQIEGARKEWTLSELCSTTEPISLGKSTHSHTWIWKLMSAAFTTH